MNRYKDRRRECCNGDNHQRGTQTTEEETQPVVMECNNHLPEFGNDEYIMSQDAGDLFEEEPQPCQNVVYDTTDGTESIAKDVDETDEPLSSLNSEMLSGLRVHERSSWVTDYVDYLVNVDLEQHIPLDHSIPFDKHSKLTITKRQACVALNEISARHCLKQAVMDDFIEFLSTHTQSLNLPVIEKNPAMEKKEYQPVRNNLKMYVGEDERNCVFDICKNEHMVFFGTKSYTDQEGNQVSVDCSKLLSCLECGMQRYSKCSQPSCQSKSYEACNPFDESPGVKPHNLASRVPMRSVYYRPIIPKLLQMYKKSLRKGNKDYINYQNVRKSRPDCIIDINDGTEVKKCFVEMEDCFVKSKIVFEHANPGQTLYQCSIAMSIFYDGKTNFERKNDSMLPLLVSVINCNPSDRAKLGEGLFLTMLHNVKQGSGVENFLLDDILTEELVRLENGIIIRFEHPAPSRRGELVCVFLQARCIFAHLDTIELLHFTKTQGSGSRSGCNLCGAIHGIYRTCLSKSVYLGHRAFLHERHMLREFGQNRLVTLAAQQEYYAGEADEEPLRIAVNKVNLMLVKDFNHEVDQYDLPAHPYTDSIFTKCAAEKRPQVWYNYDFPITDFADILYYPMPDNREAQFSRRSNHEYIEDGEQAILTNVKEVNGVKGVCPLLKKLKYFKYENLSWDGMHREMNSNVHFLEFYKGKRALHDLERKLCVAQGMFGFLRFTDGVVPWKMTENDLRNIDGIANCFLIPTGHKDIFNLKFPMHHSGHLRAKDHIIFLSAYAPYLYSFAHIHKGYKRFTARYASDLCRLFNPCISNDELDALILSVIETRSIQEGIFPESEQFFVCHEIMEIVHNIKTMGHIKGQMCFFGERALAIIARCCPKGGVNYLRALYYKYVALENILSSITNNRNNIVDTSFLDNCGRYSDFALKLYGNSDSHQLNRNHKNVFWACVIEFLDSQVIDNIITKSSLYRMHVIYEHNCKALQFNIPGGVLVEGFSDWIDKLFNAYNMHKQHGLPLMQYARGLVSEVNGAGDGALNYTDFGTIIREVANFFPVVYTKAIIKGISFRCRGVQYSETAVFTSRRVRTAPGEPLINKHTTYVKENEVDFAWSKALQYSSWVQITNHFYGHDIKRNAWYVQQRKEIGQLNYCFRLKLPCDAICNGLAFGNVSFHKSTIDKSHGNLHCINVTRCSYYGKRNFVCLNYVDSTSLAVSALDNVELPVFKSETYNSCSWTMGRDKINLSSSGVVDKLYFIPMHPERQTFWYGDVEKDDDGTKCFE